MTLIRKDISRSIQVNIGTTEKKSLEIVETVIELIKRSLENGDDVLNSGFGKFCVREKNERRGRNPNTGDGMMIRPRTVVTFRCSGKLRDKLNGG